MKSFLTILFGFFSFSVIAAVTAGPDSCPIQFEGRVKAIIEEVGPERAFSTKKIIFTNQRTLKGDLDEQVTLDLLKNGPFSVEQDKEYRVLMRSTKLCWIEEL